MLTGLCKSVQAEFDAFFGHLHQQAQLLRHICEQAFAQARAKLSPTTLPALNDRLVAQLEHAGGLPRWHGLRRAPATAPPCASACVARHMPGAACADLIAFGLYLPPTPG